MSEMDFVEALKKFPLNKIAEMPIGISSFEKIIKGNFFYKNKFERI